MLSTLSLATLDSILLQQKVNTDKALKYKLITLATSELQRIEGLLTNNYNLCRIPETPAVMIMRASLAWWQQLTCQGSVQGFQYYYGIEKLIQDDCADVVVYAAAQASTAQYYRISILMLPLHESHHKVLLQSSWVTPVVSTKHCMLRRHNVKSGRQMIRQLV